MKKLVKRLTSLLIIAVMMIGLLPSFPVRAAVITKPPVFSEVEIRAKMNTLIRTLSNRYFTSNQRPAGDVSTTCDVSNVVASDWLIDLLGDANYQSFSVVNFPCQYYTTAGGSVYQGGYSGYSCWGFANFAEYYLYSSCSTDNLVGEMIYSGYASMDAIRKYARTGDLIRFGSSSGHSVIFYSIVDEDTILALDSNWYDDCMVTFGARGLTNMSRNGSRMMTITRASNYAASAVSTPQTPEESQKEESSENSTPETSSEESGKEESQNSGNDQNSSSSSDSGTSTSSKSEVKVNDTVEVTSTGLNMRSAASTSSSVLTVLTNRTQVKLLAISEDGYWGKVSYNNYTGWIFLSYVKKVESEASLEPQNPTPSVTPEESSKEESSSEASSENTSSDRVVEVTASALNCRSGASTSYQVVQVLKKGVQVKILEVSGNGLWGKCEYNGKIGWISLYYTEDVDTKLQDTSKTEESQSVNSVPEISKNESSKAEESKPATSTNESSREESKPVNSQPETSVNESSKEESKPVVSQPETSKEESSKQETVQTGRLVVITGNWLNVRKGPHTDYAKIGELAKNDQVLILETTADGGWGRIDYQGQEGWIFLFYTEDVKAASSQKEESQPETSQKEESQAAAPQPETSANENSKAEESKPEAAEPTVTEPTFETKSYNAVHHVTATLGLNMRLAPTTDSQVIYGVPSESDVTVTEITTDGIWGKTTLDGHTGWINLQYTRVVTGSQSSSQNQTVIETTAYSDFRLVTAELGLNMRVSPSADAKVIYGVPYAYKVVVTEISTDGVWGKITLDGYTGWINLRYTQVITSFSEVSSQNSANYPTVSLGSTGEYVEILQNRLMELGYNCGGADGYFGNMTRAEVIRFQTAKELTADGVVDQKTWAALYE